WSSDHPNPVPSVNAAPPAFTPTWYSDLVMVTGTYSLDCRPASEVTMMFAARTSASVSFVETATSTVSDSPGSRVPPSVDSDSQGRSVVRSSSTSTRSTSSAIWSTAHSAPLTQVASPPPCPGLESGNHHALTIEQSSGSTWISRLRESARSEYQMVSEPALYARPITARSGGVQWDNSSPGLSWEVPATVPIRPLNRPPT